MSSERREDIKKLLGELDPRIGKVDAVKVALQKNGDEIASIYSPEFDFSVSLKVVSRETVELFFKSISQ